MSGAFEALGVGMAHVKKDADADKVSLLVRASTTIGALLLRRRTVIGRRQKRGVVSRIYGELAGSVFVNALANSTMSLHRLADDKIRVGKFEVSRIPSLFLFVSREF